MLLYTHSLCLAHDAGSGHAETPARLHAVLAALTTPPLNLVARQASAATVEQLQRVHTADHVAHMLRLTDTPEPVALDADTQASRHSIAAALHAAGAVIAAVNAVWAGPDHQAFCAVRPPGHHAEPHQAMGFCYFSNAAVGAAHALTFPAVERVAIVDFDVHHGNGTQAWAETEPRALFCSTHQMPLYPGTGFAHETGAHGNILNVPFPPGAASAEFRRSFTDVVLPRLAAFAPDMLFVSAGFDAHAFDPLGGMQLLEADYAWVAAELADAARRLCNGRMVSCLEGGYDPPSLGSSARAYCEAVMAVMAPATVSRVGVG